jgi:hypothetical protein
MLGVFIVVIYMDKVFFYNFYFFYFNYFSKILDTYHMVFWTPW